MTSRRILGVRVDCVDMAGALDAITAMVASGLPTQQVATINPEFVMHARRDPEFATVLERSELCLADGAGVLWALRRSGCALPARVAGSDLVPILAPVCARHGWRLYLLGAAPGVAEEAGRRLAAGSPGLLVVGADPGSPEPAADERVTAAVNASRPDVLLVAYGHPKQELWISRNRARLQVPVAIGVGGALDFIAGRARRAPAAFRRVHLEWLWRLAHEPWRAGRMAVLPEYALRVLATAARRR